MADFSIKRGDSEPAIKAQLQDDEGNAVDLSNADSVSFHMKDPRASTVKVDAAASITDAPNGEVQYDWADDGSDTDEPGEYDAEFEVSWSGGGTETFPNDGFLTVGILEDIA